MCGRSIVCFGIGDASEYCRAYCRDLTEGADRAIFPSLILRYYIGCVSSYRCTSCFIFSPIVVDCLFSSLRRRSSVVAFSLSFLPFSSLFSSRFSIYLYLYLRSSSLSLSTLLPSFLPSVLPSFLPSPLIGLLKPP